MDEVDRSRDFKSRDLGITTAFFLGVSSAEHVSRK